MIKKYSTEHKQPYPLIADDFNGLKTFYCNLFVKF